jgi:sigma-B regulation protein RsbU (phosphoserine phosphatase)
MNERFFHPHFSPMNPSGDKFLCELPAVKGLDYYGECQPAGCVGGDFFDFVSLRDHGLAVSVGDVSGHSAGAAIMTSGLRTYLRGLTAFSGRELTTVVEELNRVVCETSQDNFYVTLFHAHVDPSGRQIHYVSAGHEPALLIDNGTGIVQRLDRTGTVLGLTARSRYEQRVVAFSPGDILVAFTDGIPDTTDDKGRELGHQGVVRLVRNSGCIRAVDLVNRIMEEANRFARDAQPSDGRSDRDSYSTRRCRAPDGKGRTRRSGVGLRCRVMFRGPAA